MEETAQSGRGSGAALRLPPGPRLPYPLQTLLLWQFTGPFLRYCRRRFGPTFLVRAYPSEAAVYLTEPEDIKAAFNADPDVLRAGEANAILGPVLGRRSILLADGDEHLRRRRLMLPLFHGDAVPRYGVVVSEIVDAEVAGWPEGRPIRLHKRMQAITLEVILRAVIGVEDERRLARLRTALRRVVEFAPGVLLMWVWPRLGAVGRWRRQLAFQAEAERLLDEEISARRAAADLDQRTDVLSLLIGARYEDGSAMDDEELRDQIMTLLMAGHETTATGLAWAFERLVRHPEVLARAFGAAEADDDTYLDAIVKETLRVRPVIPDVARVVAEPIELAGYRLPAGVTVMPCISLVQQGPAFADATEFRPERFLGEGQAPPYAWIPFGGGRRRCLGAAFASFEMRTVLKRMLLERVFVPTASRSESALPNHITLIPLRGAKVASHRRPRAAEQPSVASQVARAAPTG